MRETVKGNQGLASRLGVHPVTISKWKKAGLLQKAILVNFGRTIVYDLEKVYECLNYKPVKAGRPRQYQ